MAAVYGALMVGALGVSNNLGGVATNPQSGFQQGSAAIVSQNFGAGHYRRVLDAFYVTLLINVLLGSGIAWLMLHNAAAVSSIFDGGNGNFRQLIIQVYRYEALGATPLGAFSAVIALLYGLGKTRLTLLLNAARVFVFRIPVFWLLQHRTRLGPRSVGIVMMVSNVSVAAMALIVALVVIGRYRRRYLKF